MGTVMVTCFLGILGHLGAPSDATLEAIRTAYAANRAALGYGTVRFEVAAGHAKDVESARRGDFARIWTATGFYVFDGPRARYEVVYPIADMVSARIKTSPKSWTSPLSSERFLTDGRITLIDKIEVNPDDREYFHTAQINPGTETAFGNGFLFPLDLGNPRPKDWELDRAIGDMNRPGTSMSVIEFGPSSPRDPSVLRFIIEWKGPPVGRLDYLIDLEKGAIPKSLVMVPEFVDGRKATDWRTECDDIRPVGEGRYLPYRYLVLDTPPNGGGPRFARQLRIIEADFATRPAASQFRLEFPEARTMTDSASMVRYPAQKTWDLANLPRAASPGNQKLTMSGPPATAPEMPGPIQPRSQWPFVLMGLGALIVAVALVFAWRRSHA